jgi:hypothetical protein
MKEYLGNYFNFGFIYEDFQAYLLKLTYCRELRKFIKQKRMRKLSNTLGVQKVYQEASVETIFKLG